MDLGIKDRLAVVTGAESGIGLAAAKMLAAEGVRLILSDLDEDDLKKAATGVPNVVDLIAADLTDAKDQARLARAAEEAGGADILVHSAGITGEKGDPLDMTDEDFNECWRTNLLSAVAMCRQLVPGMAERGWGRVVFVTSENAVQPYPDEVVYNCSKAALLSFAKGLSLPYGPKGVRVNTVAPAFIETPMTDGMMEKRAEEQGVSFDEAVESFLEEERPYLTLKRRGKPDEVAAAIALLCSEHASFTNGSAYRVDGGAVAAINT